MIERNVAELLQRVLREAHVRGAVGDTPYQEARAVLDILAEGWVETAQPGEPIAGGRMKGRGMIIWEGPADVFDRMVLNDRRWRKEHGDA